MDSRREDKKDKIVLEAEEFIQNKVRPFAKEFEEQEGIPLPLIREMGERGFLAAPWPKKYGGRELNAVSYGLLTEAVGKGCSSTRALMTVHTSLVGSTILRWGTEEQKETYLPSMARGELIGAFGLSEPSVGTDAASIQTTYEVKDGVFVINGGKKWISLAGIANVFIIIAQNKGVVTAFLVNRNTSGVSIELMKGLLGSRAAYVGRIKLTNVHVESCNVLGKIGSGFSFIVNTALDHGRYSIAWGGVALAEAALEEMVTYSRKRKQFNQFLREFQLIRGIIADATVNVHAARAMCINAGMLRDEGDEKALMETTIAKYFTSKVAMQTTHDAVQVFGGNGCIDDFPVARLFREAKILEIIEGTNQIQQEIISRFAIKEWYLPKASWIDKL